MEELQVLQGVNQSELEKTRDWCQAPENVQPVEIAGKPRQQNHDFYFQPDWPQRANSYSDWFK